MPPSNVSSCPLTLATTPVTAVPAALVCSRTASAPVSSVTFGYSIAGRTAITSASDLACTRHGKPSQFWQRTHRLNGMLRLVEQYPAGGVERVQSRLGEVIGELLDPRLVRDRRERIGRAGGWLGRILAVGAVDLVELLGLRVVRLHLARRRSATRARSRRGDAAPRSPPRAAGTAQPRRAWSPRRRSSAPAAGTRIRRRSTRCPARCSGRRRTRRAPASSGFTAAASRPARAAGSACPTQPACATSVPPPAPLPMMMTS